MSHRPGLSRPQFFGAIATVTAVTAGIAVALASGAVGQTSHPQTTSLSQSARPAGAQTGKAANPSTAKAAKATKAAKKTVTCTPKNTKLKITKVSKPVNHLLLSATNTSKNNCNAFSAPALRMTKNSQSATWVIQETQPQAVVTLFPGETAYASIIISGINEREGNPTTRQIGVYFDGGKGEGSVGSEGKLKLPGKGIINSDDAMVTYWQYSKADALSW